MDFPLPQVQSALRPYIQKPLEATYIRQVVTQHLNNLCLEKRATDSVGGRDEFRRFLDFELGRGEGVRKEYLEALREEAEARKALEAEEGNSDEEEEEAVVEAEEDGVEGGGRERGRDRWIGEYLSTIELTRQFEKLEILQIYLRTFNDPAVLEAEDKHKIHFNDLPPNPPAELTTAINTRTPSANSASIGEEVTVRLLNLEKTILQTHDSLLRENSRLQQVCSDSDEGRPRGSKKEAFARARDALITWVESQLSHTSTIDDSLPSTTATTTTTTTPTQTEKTSVEDIIGSINDAYEEYLSARQEVVEVLSSVDSNLQPIPITTESPDLSPAKLTKPLPAPEILKVLGAVEELVPLLKAQKSLLSQKTFFLSALAAKQKGLFNALEEKCDDTFTIAGGARGGRSASMQVAGVIADRGGVAMEKFSSEVEGYVRAANKTLEAVVGLLGEAEGLVIKKSKGEKEETKIPVRRKPKRREPEEVERGFWGAIAGNVGVIGDGI